MNEKRDDGCGNGWELFCQWLTPGLCAHGVHPHPFGFAQGRLLRKTQGWGSLFRGSPRVGQPAGSLISWFGKGWAGPHPTLAKDARMGQPHSWWRKGGPARPILRGFGIQQRAVPYMLPQGCRALSWLGLLSLGPPVIPQVPTSRREK